MEKQPDASDQKQLVEKATELTKMYQLENVGNLINVFDLKQKIPDAYTDDIQGFYEIRIKDYIQKNQKVPELPTISVLEKELIARVRQYLLQVDTQQFINPFTKEALENESEIENLVKKHLETKQKDESFSNVEHKNLFEYPANMALIMPGSENEVNNESPKVENFPRLVTSHTYNLLKEGDATNPNTILAFYYLKMRDYVRVMRRLMSFVKFYEGNEKEHTFVNIKVLDANNVQENVTHIYSTSHKKSVDEKDRLKRYMHVDDIKSYKKKMKST